MKSKKAKPYPPQRMRLIQNGLRPQLKFLLFIGEMCPQVLTAKAVG
ncbi:MAG: hypothetical protein LBU13_11625 [Synergistaceae bacterium]|jgi:hypothetical protein|nr:hypothetical protein [Synergistaceae bacterium]